MPDDLARRQTIRDLVSAYQGAVEKFQAAYTLIADGERLLNAAFNLAQTDHHAITLRGRRWETALCDPATVLENLRRDVWSTIVDRLEIRGMLSIHRAAELDEQLEKGELPELTEEAVWGFANAHLARLPEMLDEAVQEVFEFLRPRGESRAGKLKTNSEFEVPRRVILDWMVEIHGFKGHPFHVAYGHGNERDPEKRLTALDNVFAALDGRGQIQKGYRSELTTAINDSATGAGETRYFRFRACKNRSLHLEFKRVDLLDRFNQIAGGRRLRPAAA